MKNHKPIKITLGALALIIIALAIVANLPVGTHPAPQTAQNANASPTADELWLYTNNERARHGLAPLVMDPRLTASATSKCVDMVTQNYWGHTNPQGKPFQAFIQDVLPDSIRHYYSGENLSIDYNTSKSVVDAWIASPSHEVNIVNPHYRYVGYAICTNAQSKIMVVQQFLSQ